MANATSLRELRDAPGYYETKLRDGTLGYSMKIVDYDSPLAVLLQRPVGRDDCLQAAVATCLQVPTPRVPNLHLDEQLSAGKEPAEIDRLAWSTMVRWAARRGLTIMIHPRPPTSERRWIGVVPGPADGAAEFQDHCLVMSRNDLLFDPMSLGPAGLASSFAQPRDIDYGIAFSEKE